MDKNELKNLSTAELKIRREKTASMREQQINAYETTKQRFEVVSADSEEKFISYLNNLRNSIAELTDALDVIDNILGNK